MSGFLRFISPLVHPVGCAWLLLLVAAVLCLKRGRRPGAAVCATAALLLWLMAQPIVTGPLLGRLERPWLQHSLADAPAGDVVIVLGGGWRPSRGDYMSLDLTPAGDRLIAGFELCRSGKVPAMVVGGDPDQAPSGMRPDSDQVHAWMKAWNLSPAEFHTLGPVRNTRDEAERASELVAQRGWKRILLVTSALHMRRAVAVFNKAGLTVLPVACDFQVVRVDAGSAPGWRAFPDDEAFLMFSLWWHEQLGWLAYRLMGHV